MNLIELFLLAAIWGASFLFMRVATPEFGPIALIALRVGIAALVLIPALRAAEARQQFRARWWPLFIVGLTNSAIPFCLLAYSTLYLNAGLDSVLNATTPLWAALIAATLFQSPMMRGQLPGLLLGLIGVVILVWDTLSAGIQGATPAIAAALLATLFYGFAVNYSKRRLAGIRPLVVAFGSQFFASIVLIPLALLSWPRHSVMPLTWLCVAALGMLCTGFAYVLFFRLVEHVGAAYAASVTFLIPLFGVAWGALFLDEKITPRILIGCVIILVGTALATRKLRLAWCVVRKRAFRACPADRPGSRAPGAIASHLPCGDTFMSEQNNASTLRPFAYVLAVQDLDRSAAYFRDVLGFREEWADASDWRLVSRGQVRIMLGSCPGALAPSAIGDHSYFGYMEVDDVDALHEELVQKGARILQPPMDRPYAMREFVVATPEGHRFVIGQTLARN